MTEVPKILVVDDRPSNVKALRVRLASRGYNVLEATSGTEALEIVSDQHPDLVLLDVMMPGMDGFEVCSRIKAHQGNGFIPVILVTAKTETDSVVKGLELGADEYVTKPYDPLELMARVESMLRIRRIVNENTHLKQELAGTYQFENLIGRSTAMKQIYTLLEKVMASPVTVLLTGETGTGKEAMARALHYSGPRKEGRFVGTNCGALAESLLESELFGHRRGAFTDAAEDREGLFEAADGGTIFLDEVGETSPAMQVRLLRVLQESEVTRVGETAPRKIDVRVIAATNKDLKAETLSGRFREDLFYRLNVFPVEIPPLRERREDIPLLADHFLSRNADRSGLVPAALSGEALKALCAYDWPGNVRELENEIERARVMCAPDSEIALEHLSDRFAANGQARSPRRDGALRDAVSAVEREMIEAALEQCGGNRTRMAKRLGITRYTLLQKMKAFGMA